MKEAGVTLDFKRITLGNLISMGTIIVSAFAIYTNLKSDIAVMQNDIKWIKQNMVQAPAPPSRIVSLP